MKNRSNKITPFTDAGGRSCVRVQLASRAGYAVLDAEDFDRLRASGITDNWYLNGTGRTASKRAYVKCMTPCDSRVLARLIVEAPPHHQVRYRDSDRLNLRRSNLLLTRGGRATMHAAEVLDESAAGMTEGEML
jgi:hypothetical protein